MTWTSQDTNTHVRVTEDCTVRVTEAGVTRIVENDDEMPWCGTSSSGTWTDQAQASATWSES